MALRISSLNPETASREEILAEIDRLTLLKNQKANEEQAIKIFINSIYGASASPYFVGYNTRVAEAITLQGQEMIQFVSKVVNRYFLEFWHKDKSLHAELGLTHVEKAPTEVVIYGDTDSAYVSFEHIVYGCDWTGDPIDLILGIYEKRLSDYLDKAFTNFAERCGTTNIQNLEMETISYSGMFLKKKKYVLDKAWKSPGVRFVPQSKIDAKGVEIAKGSSPQFVRVKIKEMLKTLFRDKKKTNMKDFVNTLKTEKESFKLSNIESISTSSSISDYDKSIANDRTKFEINQNCPMHVRAAGYHNFVLNQSKWKNKYQLIKSGDKIYYFYAKASRGEEDVFAFLPGSYPVEFAPQVDYDKQFAKVLIDPLNRFISCMGLSPISPELIVKTQLF
jgi:DNA polymerase elongation subunit (family B)